jgi:thymidylate kinase
MFIAIEGCDGSGKSTLINALEEELLAEQPDLQIIKHHKGRPPEETRRCLLKEYAINLDRDDIFSQIHLADRWLWGERSYAPIKRPHTNTDGYGLLGKTGWRWVELFMQSRGMAQFLLHQPLDVIIERVGKRGDDFVNLDELATIHQEYSRTAAMESILADILSPGAMDRRDYPAYARVILDTAAGIANRARFLGAYPEYIGVTRPSVLIVGDRRNITEQYGEESILPFMPISTGSGEFLMRSIPDSLWATVGIINGNEVKPERLRALHSELGAPPVAVLGRLAEKAIISAGVPPELCTILPHPQYVRRFRYSDCHEYGVAIQKVSMRESVGEWELR